MYKYSMEELSCWLCKDVKKSSNRFFVLHSSQKDYNLYSCSDQNSTSWVYFTYKQITPLSLDAPQWLSVLKKQDSTERPRTATAFLLSSADCPPAESHSVTSFVQEQKSWTTSANTSSVSKHKPSLSLPSVPESSCNSYSSMLYVMSLSMSESNLRPPSVVWSQCSLHSAKDSFENCRDHTRIHSYLP